MKKSAALTALIISLALPGCGIAVINKTMASWMNYPESALVASWGPAQQVYSDGQGGHVLVYLLDRPYTVPASSTTTTFTNGGVVGNQFYGYAQGYTTYTPEHTAGHTACRIFWTDANGIVYRWQWKGF